MNLPASIRFIERDWLSANHVLMHDEDGSATLVDTGYDKHVPLTCRLVEQALARPPIGQTARLTRIINTHLHSDHCGGNAALAAAHDCAIIVPKACLEAVRQWDTDALSYRVTGQRCTRFSATAALNPGDTFNAGGLTWEAHAAPGHDPTSLVFFNRRHRILISADALWESGFGVIFPELLGASGFAEQEAVLELIAGLAPTTIMPGHGPIFHDLDAALRTAHDRLAALRADPRRNGRHALKVLLKFVLLDHERLSFAQALQVAEGAAGMRAAAATLDMPLADALDWAADSLLAQGQIHRQADLLINAH